MADGASSSSSPGIWGMTSIPGQDAGVAVSTKASDPDKPLYNPRDQIIRTPTVGYRGQLGSSTGVLYTAPSITSSPTGTAPCTSLLKSLVICNTDSSARTYTITLVESGGSVAANRNIFDAVSIAAKTTHTYTYEDETFPLAEAETINGLADSANKVTVRIGVVELTH